MLINTGPHPGKQSGEPAGIQTPDRQHVLKPVLGGRVVVPDALISHREIQASELDEGGSGRNAADGERHAVDPVARGINDDLVGALGELAIEGGFSLLGGGAGGDGRAGGGYDGAGPAPGGDEREVGPRVGEARGYAT